MCPKLKLYKKRKAFSLIELVVTIAIIGVFATVAIPSYRSYILKARISSLVQLSEGYKPALVEYMQTSGDTTCANFAPYPYVYSIHDETETLYGDIGITVIGVDICGVLAASLGNFNNDAGTSLYIGSQAIMAADRSITWRCGYVYLQGPNGPSPAPGYLE